jgi:surface antigen
MDGPVVRRTVRPPYSGTARARLRCLAGVVALGLTGGGCAMSNSVFGGDDAAGSFAKAEINKVETTSSVLGKSGARTADAMPPEADLTYTKAAAAEVLNRGGKDASAPWENPRSGARGTVTPVAANYTRDGATCRDFLASYVRSGLEAWMQGEACRTADKDSWEVKSLRPWTRS